MRRPAPATTPTQEDKGCADLGQTPERKQHQRVCLPDTCSCCAADVTGGNVMLQRSREGAAGFKAKIADFGMARDFSVQDRI